MHMYMCEHLVSFFIFRIINSYPKDGTLLDYEVGSRGYYCLSWNVGFGFGCRNFIYLLSLVPIKMK